MRSSVILLDKAAGLSSAQAIAQVKRKLGLDKIGHSGTLDPFATGLLVCLTGAATRLANYALHGRKEYSGIFTLGYETDTEDITGVISGERVSEDRFPAPSLVVAAGSAFVGRTLQVPPRVSALKVDGKRAYDRARSGEEFELVARPIEIFQLRIGVTPVAHEYSLFVECAAGTYIRSLVRDVGRALGCGALLTSLRREVSAPFSITHAHSIDQLLPEHSLPWQTVVGHLPCIPVSDVLGSGLMQGRATALAEFGLLVASSSNFASFPGASFPGATQAVYVFGPGNQRGGIVGLEGEAWRILINLAD